MQLGLYPFPVSSTHCLSSLFPVFVNMLERTQSTLEECLVKSAHFKSAQGATYTHITVPVYTLSSVLLTLSHLYVFMTML